MSTGTLDRERSIEATAEFVRMLHAAERRQSTIVADAQAALARLGVRVELTGSRSRGRVRAGGRVGAALREETR